MTTPNGTQSYIEKIIPLLQNIEDLNSDVKSILDDAKEQGYDPASIKKVATAIIKDKIDELEEKTEDLLAIITYATNKSN